MNAGAHGQEFKDVVEWVEMVTNDGELVRLSGAEIEWCYRSAGLVDVVVVAVGLELNPEDPARLENEIRRYLEWRKAGTPFDHPCCGSVFRNPSLEELSRASDDTPDPATAGRLVDAAGLKGFKVGGAEVSPMHANYIVNTGPASAQDVWNVIRAVRERVAGRFGVELQLEAKLVGEF